MKIKNTALIGCKNKLIHTYKHLISSERDVFSNFSSFHNVWKSMLFVSGGVQKDLDSKNVLRHSSSSSWSPPI